MATDHLLYFLRASTGFPAADPTRAARRGPLQTQRVDFCHGATMMRRASLSCSSTSSGGEGRLTYKDGGVDIDADAELVRRIARMAPGIGGFGGLFPYNDDYLVASTDGVGTKLKLAFESGIHDTIGIDLVAMNVNDIVTLGAKPLFFLDYYATSKLDVDLAEKVINGIRDGCEQSVGGDVRFLKSNYHDLAIQPCGIAPLSLRRMPGPCTLCIDRVESRGQGRRLECVPEPVL
ncbi:Phosphoribosylformylglycinamidine cyclo-ligase, chloroplastic/mitochondrial [Zea mays]|uniref:Phosphoribosylformylglycinamidine cyclo-ligase, chloroplastic/mitochondrial n=1 Tax=Zea mays TaxID=4577 RepID=A0A3L6DMQ0_MAIZE|nr:Phosphoribosylformylglycinamidine cyclo-ligase, chloroplastic/mitochondrial [Zea mays]